MRRYLEIELKGNIHPQPLFPRQTINELCSGHDQQILGMVKRHTRKVAPGKNDIVDAQVHDDRIVEPAIDKFAVLERRIAHGQAAGRPGLSFLRPRAR